MFLYKRKIRKDKLKNPDIKPVLIDAMKEASRDPEIAPLIQAARENLGIAESARDLADSVDEEVMRVWEKKQGKPEDTETYDDLLRGLDNALARFTDSGKWEDLLGFIFEIQKLMGHSSPMITAKHYAHLQASELHTHVKKSSI